MRRRLYGIPATFGLEPLPVSRAFRVEERADRGGGEADEDRGQEVAALTRDVVNPDAGGDEDRGGEEERPPAELSHPRFSG